VPTNISIKLDVWDWKTKHIRVRATDGTTHDVAHVGMAQMTFGGPGEPVPPGDDEDGRMTCVSAPRGPVLARGIRVMNSEVADVEVTRLEIAPFRSPPAPTDLNQETIDRAASQGSLITLSFPPVRLAPGEEMLVILDRPERGLPEELRPWPLVAFDLGEVATGSFVAAVSINSGQLLTAKTFGAPNDTFDDARSAMCAIDRTMENCCSSSSVLVASSDEIDSFDDGDTSLLCVMGGDDASYVSVYT
jgi:hypothetical protein